MGGEDPLCFPARLLSLVFFPWERCGGAKIKKPKAKGTRGLSCLSHSIHPFPPSIMPSITQTSFMLTGVCKNLINQSWQNMIKKRKEKTESVTSSSMGNPIVIVIMAQNACS